MALSELNKTMGSAFLVGSAVGISFYGLTSYAMTGPLAEFVPVCGAVIISGLVQTMMIRRNARRRSRQKNMSLEQRLNVFEKHAIMNVVDENDRITEVNDALLELTGFAREDLIGQHVKILYDPASHFVASEIRKSLERGEIWQGETPLRRADDSVYYTQATIMPVTDAAGNWRGSVAARTDVTQTRNLMAEHHTAQTLYELRDDIWIVDAESETFSYLNGVAKENLEWRGNVTGQSLSDLPSDDGVQEVANACRTLTRNGTASTSFETVFMDMPVHVSIKLVPGVGSADRCLVLISDISDRVEQDRRNSDFISTVSHELRSPLTSIKGAMGLLLARAAGDLPDSAKAMLEIAHRNADRLVLIINDILDLEKISNGQMEFEISDVDVRELVAEADRSTAMLQQRFAVGVDLKGFDEPLHFRTDPNRFIQVLTNLLSNAYKYSNAGDRIVIAADRTVDGGLQISVTDRGPGIPHKDQQKIFQRFADLSNSDRAAKGGTGLGLNICKTIVEGLGGSIGFQSQLGIGTTFHFTLPVGSASQAEEPASDDMRAAS